MAVDDSLPQLKDNSQLFKHVKNLFKISVYKVVLSPDVKNILNGISQVQKDLSDTNSNSDLQKIGSTSASLVDTSKGFIKLLTDNKVLDYTLGDSISDFYLPMPNSIRESISQKYDETNFNLEELMARGTIGAATNAIGSVSSDLATGIQSTMALAEHLAKRGNLTIDPNPLMTYSGSLPRTFTFDFILNPNSAEEASYYHNVVKRLKYYSTIERTENTFFGELAIRTLSMTKCFSFKCIQATNTEGSTRNLDFINILMNTYKGLNTNTGFYLSNINLIVGGQDSLQIYYDGAPKTVHLSLSFVERAPLWDDSWKDLILNKWE
jgi:hypothetical protein